MRRQSTHFEAANGNSKLPGTDCTTMLLSFTPVSLSFAMVPATSASMTVLFHRECTMATRSGEPSSLEGGGAGPLIESDIVSEL